MEGRSFAKVTEPGPRNLPQDNVTGGVLGRVAPGITLASSATHSGRGSGLPTAATNDLLCPRGPLMNGPLSSKPIHGGVFPLASSKGESCHSGARLPGICVAAPLAVM